MRTTSGETSNFHRIWIWEVEQFCYMNTDTDGRDNIKIESVDVNSI